ncbi:hypothetical protein F4776DRAFT_481598 [Hypoxylon sp. NC0597]|nr:hypothetical protein F4776DRAFT_481598 [Hypoxylon sp. NC0597]
MSSVLKVRLAQFSVVVELNFFNLELNCSCLFPIFLYNTFFCLGLIEYLLLSLPFLLLLESFVAARLIYHNNNSLHFNRRSTLTASNHTPGSHVWPGLDSMVEVNQLTTCTRLRIASCEHKTVEGPQTPKFPPLRKTISRYQ